MEFLENIQKWRFCKCWSAHIRHASYTKVTNVCIYIFSTHGQFVLVVMNYTNVISKENIALNKFEKLMKKIATIKN